MKKKNRIILFFILFIAFLIISPLIILYSQGYRFNFKSPDHKIITQTGGLFVAAKPKQVNIFLNQKLVKKTDFFFGSAFIKNILPGEYRIKLTKENFHPWEKTLKIEEKKVTEIKHILLFPEDSNISLLAKNTENIWLSPDQKMMVAKEKENNHWALKLYYLNKNTKSHLIREDEISINGVKLLNLNFSEDSKRIYLKTEIKGQIKNFSLDITRLPPLLKTKEETSLPKNIICQGKRGDDVYYLDNSGNLYKTDNSFSLKEKMTDIPLSVTKEKNYKLFVFPEFIFLKEDSNLYLFSSNSRSFEKFFDNSITLKISLDLKKVLYASSFEIWILSLEDDLNPPKRKKGEPVFLVRLSDKIRDIFWLNSYYLIFSVGDKIKIAEIDTRDGINITEIAEFKNPKIIWSNAVKNLYILSGGNLFLCNNLLI